VLARTIVGISPVQSTLSSSSVGISSASSSCGRILFSLCHEIGSGLINSGGLFGLESVADSGLLQLPKLQSLGQAVLLSSKLGRVCALPGLLAQRTAYER
jgi:hypothetical protein